MRLNKNANVMAQNGLEAASDRMRHAAAHLAEGERPETVAMWFDVPLETVYSLLGRFDGFCKGGE